jgi:hypothetical protein
VSVGGSIGNFPIPSGANVLQNVQSNGQYDIAISGVTASTASSFWTTALPQAGYTITQNTSGTGTTFSGTAITFTGHGYKGTIGAFSGTGSVNGVSISSTTGNIIGITLVPQS